MLPREFDDLRLGVGFGPDSVLAELKALRASGEVRAKPALERLVGEVHVLTGLAADRIEQRCRELRKQNDEASLARATELALRAGSVEALGPRATRALIIASLLHMMVVTVVVLVEIVVALVLYLERDALLEPGLDLGTAFAWAMALQLLLVPRLLRWIEAKLVWGPFDETLADLEAVLGVRTESDA